MTVLVTGGSGLVGSHVIEALRSRGEEVRALVRASSLTAVERLGAEAAVGDVTDRAAWRAASRGIRGIVHAAALVAQRAPLDRFVAINVGGTRLAIETARASGTPLVHISSVAVYGRIGSHGPQTGKVREDFSFQPLPEYDFYARTKRMAETVLAEEAARGELAAAVIRPNVIYGEHDRLFSPRVVRFLRFGIAPRIGAGTNRLSCVYAGNVAAAVVAALDAARPGVRAYNTTNDGDLTQREFIDTFAAALGRSVLHLRVPISVAALGVELWARWQRLLHADAYAGLGRAAVHFLVGENPYDSGRARAELGWRPAVEPREAIHRTVRWLRGNEKPGS